MKLKQSTLPHKSPKKRKQGDEFIVKTHGGTLSVPIMPKGTDWLCSVGFSHCLGPKLNDCESDDIESFDDDIESNMAENKGSFYMHETIYNFGNKAGVDEETQRMDEDFQVRVVSDLFHRLVFSWIDSDFNQRPTQGLPENWSEVFVWLICFSIDLFELNL